MWKSYVDILPWKKKFIYNKMFSSWDSKKKFILEITWDIEWNLKSKIKEL